MTKRQREVARAVIECQLEGKIPSLKRLAKRLRLKRPRCVGQHLMNLERQGIIEREGKGTYSNETRTLRVIWPAKNLIRPPYRVLWSMNDGRLVYAPKDVIPRRLDHQNGDFCAS